MGTSLVLNVGCRWSGVSPSAISKYEFAFFDDKKPPESLVIDARKQLSYLGWQIERKKYKNTYRYRYISPDATKIYFSLHQLCHDLRDPIMQSQRIPKPKRKKKGAKVHYRASKCKGRNQLTEG
ncbi:hypothetical protein GH714_004428 [Hevea brasiliensis]|uniref:DUF7028 domain-containing protein n=1 Tax=Hevea brasiliensis TaxID=3981 RepID=A0A6A6MB50_HEVBR|nr:hypothetical protein GH714_004428 [Hevea brasiliensis]